MSILSYILVVLVALEAIFIMLLEMFAVESKMSQKAFGLSPEYLSQKEAKIAMANQGLYNGFVGVGILVVLFVFPSNAVFYGALLFVGFVVIAAIYGSLTVNPKVIFSQGLLAILAVLSLLFT
ncbi:MAG: DUF1304 domain-containing protein [Liquorilactobacillus hordei]|uniref:Integral membrane protein n=1 Tax=Liquorilactobacillus hordei DSM 19519 TaxID=1423759 RepID=A0A0R1MI51_9LACO|nr:DUF1304 domain-containing protein [Liquorilactobacillus hordei]KRL07664.1 hypothetical protein FC92_GL001609 [Liquorilactobacillus hordei DSM 19519]QYH52627.1 DUF1304 domain-containing protein [Liquorilactobacillus hordei DSM 19519]